MKINPFAVVFWLVCISIGLLISGDWRGAVAGFLVGVNISLFAVAFFGPAEL